MGKKFIGITANSKSELIRQIDNVAAQENLNNTPKCLVVNPDVNTENYRVIDEKFVKEIVNSYTVSEYYVVLVECFRK